MHLVNSLVERAVVKSSVEPVVPGILHDEEDGNLDSHLKGRGERHSVIHTKVSGNGVENPNLRKFGSEVADEDNGGAIPLFLEGRNLLALNLVFLEVRDLVHNHKGNASAEVDKLMHDETQDAGREGIVLHVQVPSLSPVELAIGSLMSW